MRPRDTVILYTRPSGNKGRSKINEVAYNGIDILINAIRDDFGISVNHYVAVDFAGFQGLIDAVHGVPVYFPAAARDFSTGLEVPAGCQVLTGEQALAYARSRKYQFLGVDNRWHGDSTDDYGRIRRQQDLIRRAIKKAIASGARNPTTMLRLIESVMGSATFDDQFNSADKVFSFAKTMKDLDPDKIKTYTIQVTGYEGWEDGLKAVDNKANASLFQYFAQGTLGDGFTPTLDPTANGTSSSTPETGTTSTVPTTVVLPVIKPSQVHVQVFNSSGVPGVGKSLSDDLQARNFTITAATAKGEYQPTTEIRYGEGAREQAEFLARYLDVKSPKIVADPTVNANALELYVGEDLKALLTTPKAAVTTTTLAPGQVTTTTVPAQPEAPSAPRTFGPDPANTSTWTPEQLSDSAACV